MKRTNKRQIASDAINDAKADLSSSKEKLQAELKRGESQIKQQISDPTQASRNPTLITKIANDDIRREHLRRTFTQDINEMNVVLDNTKESLQAVSNELSYLSGVVDNPRYGGYLATYVENALKETREGIEDLNNLSHTPPSYNMQGITNRGDGEHTPPNGLNEAGIVAISSAQAVVGRLSKIEQKVGWDVKNEDGKQILSNLKNQFASLNTNLEGYYNRHAKADLLIDEAKALSAA